MYLSKKEARRILRKRSTAAEKRLWKILRNRKFEDKKFRRQHSIGKYIVDFYCHEERLIIELDGPPHQSIKQKIYDQRRDRWLMKQGNKILRIENDFVFSEIDWVLEKIEECFTSPQPSPQGEGVPS